MNQGEGLIGLIQRRLGYLPGFLSAAAPQVLENLWTQTDLAYLDNPLPQLFKEKLLAYLSRYCPHRYWLIWHSCRLRELGMTSGQVAHLLKRPTPMPSELPDQIDSIAALAGWPEAASPAEWAIFWLAVVLFLQRDDSQTCREAIARVLGQGDFEHLVALLAYARTVHLWVQSHPQLSPERDLPVERHLRLLRQEEPSLVEIFDAHARSAERAGQVHSEHLVYAINQRDHVARLLGKCDGCPGTALMHAPFPVMIYADDGQVVQINDLWTELSGYTLSDIPTMAVWCEKAQPGTEPHSHDDIDALFESDQRVEEGETSIVTRHGGQLVWDFASVPLGRLPDGRRAIMRVASDVTERKQLEQSLWKTSRRIVNILESISDGFCTLDHDGRLVYVNECAQSMMKHPRQDLIGKCICDEFPQAVDMGLLQHIQKAINDNTTVHVELCHKPLQRWFEAHIYPSPEGVSIHFREITRRMKLAGELRKTNEMLEALVRASPLAVIALDRENRVRLWSPAAERIFGWNSDEVLGNILPTLLPGQSNVHEPLQRPATRPAEPVRIETQQRTKSGRVIDVEAWMAPLTLSNGSGLTGMGLVGDITDRKRAEEAAFESSETTAAVLRASPLAIVVLDLEGVVKIWNPAAERLFGWTACEVVDKRLPIIPPDQEDRFHETRRLLIQGHADGTAQVPCMRKDGSQVMANLSIAAVHDRAGQIRSLLGMLSEVNGAG